MITIYCIAVSWNTKFIIYYKFSYCKLIYILYSQQASSPSVITIQLNKASITGFNITKSKCDISVLVFLAFYYSKQSLLLLFAYEENYTN